MTRSIDKSWNKIFKKYGINNHNFDRAPFEISAEQIKDACKKTKKVVEKEVRILCKQDSKEKRPKCFQEKGLFILPIKNGVFKILKGEGYVNIPDIEIETTYKSKIDFHLDTSSIGNSEMQHLDFAYASSIIRTFMGDDSLVLTIRGRKYTPNFSFKVGKHKLNVESVQTEVDAGYEGRDKVILVEAKNSSTSNTIIRQLFYPYRQWKKHTNKQIFLLFFEKRKNLYLIWQYKFNNDNDYNSIELMKAVKYRINSR